ncbi:MAG: hypothetical protein OXU81_02385 [Gammaproteobacteria bacterium]|nr:hypothetical protein [Gammaproteobacteria bacterium]
MSAPKSVSLGHEPRNVETLRQIAELREWFAANVPGARVAAPDVVRIAVSDLHRRILGQK